MTMHQHSQAVFTASPTSFRSVAPRSPSARPALPDRNVSSATIEDAYVTFILYCNPIFPPDADTAALRELFRLPPRSGGKSFSTFTLFELIKQLELTKELKTWAELALKLGVDPPDQEKGQSSQKIQQYAVRLKRWMHSARVDAFFAYLMDRPHPYWMNIPSDPVSTMRDGVAPEDDMALRALLPQIKPRRGRRRLEDDDDVDQSPSQRHSPMGGDESVIVQADCLDTWSAQSDVRGRTFVFPETYLPRPSAPPLTGWMGRDAHTPTPMSAYPHAQSAITPATDQSFWPDTPQSAEPRSAIMPPRQRATSKRHGAKVVSSAWRSGRVGSSGKARGRPPINRAGNEEPFSAFPTTDPPGFRMLPPGSMENSDLGHGMSTISKSAADILAPPLASGSAPLPPGSPAALAHPAQQQARSMSQPSAYAEANHGRPAKRSRLSLQVPARVGGEVRLATPPPPAVMVNGQVSQEPRQNEVAALEKERSSFLRNIVHQIPEESGPEPSAIGPTAAGTIGTAGTAGTVGTAGTTTRSNTQAAWSVTNAVLTGSNRWKFPDHTRSSEIPDRTNIDELEGYFMHEILTANWYDAHDNPVQACGPDEGWALCSAVLDHVRKQHQENKIYLLNLAALAGSSILQDPTSMRVRRFDEPDRTTYECSWQLRLGEVRSSNNLKLTIMHSKWKRAEADDRSTTAEAEEANAEVLTAEYWQRKYTGLVFALHKKQEQLKDIRAKMVHFLRAGHSMVPEGTNGGDLGLGHEA